MSVQNWTGVVARGGRLCTKVKAATFKLLRSGKINSSKVPRRKQTAVNLRQARTVSGRGGWGAWQGVRRQSSRARCKVVAALRGWAYAQEVQFDKVMKYINKTLIISFNHY